MKKPDQVAVIDATTGTVLAADNLFYVEAPEKALDKASNSDSDAFDLAHKKGIKISEELMSALLQDDPEAIIEALGWSSDVDNDGQIIAYTGERRKKRKK
jgi:hypothetical protein